MMSLAPELAVVSRSAKLQTTYLSEAKQYLYRICTLYCTNSKSLQCIKISQKLTYHLPIAISKPMSSSLAQVALDFASSEASSAAAQCVFSAYLTSSSLTSSLSHSS